MPQSEDGKAPIIKQRGVSLDSERTRELLLTGEEAVNRIQNQGAIGFCLYAGKESHNTESLVFTDHDDLQKFPTDELPDTLLIRSGSGEGRHQVFTNSGDVENSQATGELSGAGDVRAHNWYIVTPGSIHPSGGVYHILNNHSLSTLSNADLPAELQPSTESDSDELPITTTESKHLRNQIDSAKVDVARDALDKFKNKYTAAFKCLSDRLNGGRGSYGSELSRNNSDRIDRDAQEKTVLTHLYGVFKQAGHSDKQAQILAYHLLSHYCVNSNNGYTKDGEPRKWVKRSDRYRSNQLQYAVEQFNRSKFQRFCNRSSGLDTAQKIYKHQYSDLTRGLSLFAVDFCSGSFAGSSVEEIHSELLDTYGYSLSENEVRAFINNPPHPLYNDTTGPSTHVDTGTEGVYPRKTHVLDACFRLDRPYKGNSRDTFDRCLNQLRNDGKVKLAQIKQGQDYRVYRKNRSDPVGADWVKTDGEKYKPE